MSKICVNIVPVQAKVCTTGQDALSARARVFPTANEVPYFKFYPGEWMAGDIAHVSNLGQGIFIKFLVLAWTNGGYLNDDDLLKQKLNVIRHPECVMPERLKESGKEQRETGIETIKEDGKNENNNEMVERKQRLL